LPSWQTLKNICKSVSVLDAIISQEWEYRYYSYNSKWGNDEECLQMRNGSGDEMFILFKKGGCVISGFAHEYDQPEKSKVTAALPSKFDEFIFGEPVVSIGTTFCLWTNESGKWQVGQIENFDDHSDEMLNIFDCNPQTYINWATDYFEESYKESGIPFITIEKIYKGETVTKAMVLSIVNELEDWVQLEKDLNEIGYPFNFNDITGDIEK